MSATGETYAIFLDVLELEKAVPSIHKVPHMHVQTNEKYTFNKTPTNALDVYFSCKSLLYERIFFETPVIGESCTKHGICNSITHNCDCFPGWTGDGCELADCAGEPDCFDRGVCNDTLSPPRCLDCNQGWMGPA
jgi:hypothetical protein